MGVYVDYFRATNDSIARDTHALVNGPLNSVSGETPAFDGVSTKGILPDPHLEELLAIAQGRPYERGPKTSMGLWPPVDTPPPVDETSPWLTDPSVELLATRVRDGLADIDPTRIRTFAPLWAAKQYGDYPAEDAAAWITDLASLARRARDSTEELYCWSPPL
jgi:hypothetical protein